MGSQLDYMTAMPQSLRLLPEVPLPERPFQPGSGARPQLDGPEPWLWGLDLFNHGYYWEAHEVWEGLWIELGRSSPAGLLVRGLIQAAAASLKSVQGNQRGQEILAARALATLKACGLSQWRGICVSDVMVQIERLPQPIYLHLTPSLPVHDAS